MIKTCDSAEQLRGNLSSRAWRICNLHTILAGGTEDAPQVGLVPFVPNHAQKDYFNNQHFLDNILKARKLGFSTFKCVEYADLASMVPKLKIGIIDYKLEAAKVKLKMVKTSWEHMGNGDIHPETWRLGAFLKKQNPLVTDSIEQLEWANGSTLGISTSFRGDTPNYLLLSEFGKISKARPEAAREIVAGAFNSVLPGQHITSESTHENGKIGENYKLNRKAMSNEALAELTPIDWKFHFFPWWRHSQYRVDAPGRSLRPETEAYFCALENELKTKFSFEQKFWYDIKSELQGYAMKKEFPSTPGEAFEALVTGSIWGKEIIDLRAAGRITALSIDASPLFSFWDLGFSDFTSIWLIQFVGRDILVHDFYQNHRLHTGKYAEIIRGWERRYEKSIAQNFLPHDAESHGGGGFSPVEMLIAAGVSHREISIVPRCQDAWPGINHARALLSRCYFEKSTCDVPITRDGAEEPSGISCLENYKTRINQQGEYETNIIVHDDFSHPADAFRTMAEADLLSIIKHSGQITSNVMLAPQQISRFSPSHPTVRRR